MNLQQAQNIVTNKLRDKKFRPMLAVIITAIVVLVLFLIPHNRPPLPPAEAVPVNVEAQVIQPIGELPDVIQLNGIVEPNRVVDISAEVAGRIEKLCFEEGNVIQKGQEIIVINTDLLQAEYDRAKADLEYQQRELVRLEEMLKRGVATTNEVDISRTTLAVKQALFDTASARLERAVIVAPISGVLNKLPVEKGEYVQPGFPGISQSNVAQIVDIDIVKVVVEVPERDINFMKPGQKVPVIFETLGNREVEGEITYIDALSDARTRSSRIEISMANPDRLFKSGQIVLVRLRRQVFRDAIVVPLEAIIPEEKGYSAYVVENGKAVYRSVKYGIIRGQDVQITEGLKAGDKLIVKGARYVSNGQPVNEVSVEEAKP